MALIANTLTSYTAKGVREDLSSVIYNISPEETPFVSNAGRSGIKNTLTEWQTDSLQAPQLNAQLEGDDIAAFDAIQPTVRLGNVAQISRKTAVVSDTEEELDKAGRDSEMAYQVGKKGAEMKRDIEFICLSNQAANVGAVGTPRTTAALLAFLITNIGALGAGGANPAWTGAGVPTFVRTDGTQQANSETLLKDVLQKVWTSGGNPSTIMVDGPQKQTISGFSGIATKTIQQRSQVQAAIIGAADVYVGDFGTLTIVPNRFQRHRDMFVLDFEYISLAYFRKFRTKPLAKTGDAEKRLIVAEWCLKVTAPSAQGLQPDLL